MRFIAVLTQLQNARFFARVEGYFYYFYYRLMNLDVVLFELIY